MGELEPSNDSHSTARTVSVRVLPTTSSTGGDPQQWAVCRGGYPVTVASKDGGFGSAHPVRPHTAAGAVSRTLRQSVRCVSALTLNNQQANTGCRNRGRPTRSCLSTLPAGNCRQLPCVQGCRAGATPSAHGMERSGDCPEVYPHLGDSDSGCPASSTPPIAPSIFPQYQSARDRGCV